MRSFDEPVLRKFFPWVLLLVGGCGGTGWQGPVTDHFDGQRFVNEVEVTRPGAGELARWWITRDPGAWEARRDAEPGPPPPPRVQGGRLRITWVNHSAVLLQTEGLNVLFDPVWSEGRERRRPPGLRFEDLPPIDVVLISHDHWDHMDVPTLRRLARDHGARLYTGLGNATFLRTQGVVGAAELDWWDSIQVSEEVTVHAVPARHGSGRGLVDVDRTLWLGFVLETTHGPIYFAGDTGFGPHFLRIRERFGAMRLAMLPIGAYWPRSILGDTHLDPRHAVYAHRILGAKTSIGLHFGTFVQGDVGQDQPVADLRAACRDDECERFWVLDHGVGREVPHL